MSTKYFPLLSLAVLLLGSFSAEPACAAESSLSVVLPARVEKTVQNISKLSHDINRQLTSGRKSIDQVKREIQTTSDDSRLFELRSRYLDLRKSNLNLVEQKVSGIEGQLGTLALDLRQLDRVWRDSNRYGLGQGIKSDDPVAREAVSDMMQGIGSLVEMVEQQDLRSDMGPIKKSLLALDDSAHQFFRGNEQASLKEQMALVKDWLILAGAVKKLIGSEKHYLSGRHVALQNGHIARSLRQVEPASWNAEEKFRDYHQGFDREVFEANSPVSVQPARRYDTSRLGQGYGS